MKELQILERSLRGRLTEIRQLVDRVDEIHDDLVYLDRDLTDVLGMVRRLMEKADEGL